MGGSGPQVYFSVPIQLAPEKGENATADCVKVFVNMK